MQPGTKRARRTGCAWLLPLTVALACAQAGAQGIEVARGRALYEARCDKCHDESVHGRDPRSARNFAELRAFVARWDRELGALWRRDELDAVTLYLNDRYYHYPCPVTVCSSERASERTALVRSSSP